MKVFIIDDEEISLFLIQKMLAMNGLAEDIHTFLSADEALGFVAEGKEEDFPDIILLDLNMPVMNGLEFLDALGHHRPECREKCSIYILTSSLDFSDEDAARGHPLVAGFIRKPVTIDNLRLINTQREGDRPAAFSKEASSD